jgi:hypothetical protein
MSAVTPCQVLQDPETRKGCVPAAILARASPDQPDPDGSGCYPTFTCPWACRRRQGSELLLEARDREGGSHQMWDAIKAAIQSNGTTARFIVIIAVLVMAAWLIQALH